MCGARPSLVDVCPLRGTVHDFDADAFARPDLRVATISKEYDEALTHHEFKALRVMYVSR
jgi:hypothetical protein